MNATKLLRRLLTRSLRKPHRSSQPVIGRRIELLEDRLTPAFTSTISGLTATLNGDVAADTFLVTVDTETTGGPFLVHNRFTEGDAGFVSNLDWDSVAAGEQRLAAISTVTLTFETLGGGNDTLQIVRGPDGTTGSGDINAFINTDAGGAGDDSLVVNDSTRTAANTITFDSTTLLITGTGYNIDLGAAAEAGFFITTGTGDDIVNVLGTFTGQELTLNSAGGADTVNIGNAGSLTDLLSAVNVNNTPSFTTLNIDASADAAATYTLTNGQVSSSLGSPINYTAGVSAVNLTTGGNADTINVTSTGTPTNIATGAGADTITFANGATLSGGTFDGGSEMDTLDYSAYTLPVAVNLGLGVTGLSATLDGGQEVPANGSTATGTATFTNYSIADKTFDLSLTVTGIAPADVTGLHLHRGVLGVNGPVILDLLALGTLTSTANGFTLTLVGVDLDNSLLGGRANEAAFLGGVTYLNIHTAAFPSGLIRGQVFSNGNLIGSDGTATGTAGVAGVENVIGGSAADGLVGSSSANVLEGRAGDDILLGGPGADTFLGGANNDTMIWSNGDGSDVMDGEGGSDTVVVNGSLGGGTVNDVFTIGANSSRVAFARTSTGPFSLDIGTTETLSVNGGAAGTETFTVNSLANVADLTSVQLFGLAGNDTFNLNGYAPAAITVNINGGTPTNAPGDTLNFDAQGDSTRRGVSTITNGTSTITFTQIEDVDITNALLPLPDLIAASGQPNGTSLLFDTIVDGEYDPIPVATLAAFGNIAANVRAATADIDNDGIQDTVLVTGPGTPIRVAVVSGVDDVTLLVQPFDPFGGDFTGGGFVAATDLVGDGRAEFVITPDEGGGPRVSIFSLLPNGTVATLANFLGIDDDAFRGGARPALGDVDGDGFPDLVVAAGFGGGPRVALFDGESLFTTRTKLVNDFFAFPDDAQTLRNGVFAAVGDISGDGFADLIFGGGPGGAPRVYILSGEFLINGNPNFYSQPVANFFVAGNADDRGGVRLAVKNADNDTRADLVVGSGAGSPAKVRIYLGVNFTSTSEPSTFQDITPFGGAALADGVYVG